MAPATPRMLLAAACAATMIAPGLPSLAAIGPVSSELARTTAAVRAARGPEVYAALRELWRSWDRADPSQVEEVILSFATNPSTPPPARAYATLLSGYARRRRGDLEGAAARVDKLGFVRSWMVLGPFDNENKVGSIRTLEPELEIDRPLDLARTFPGKEHSIRWRVLPDSASYGWFDFGAFLRPREKACAFATTYLRPKPGTPVPRRATIWFGSEGAARVYFDGELALEDNGYRDLDADRFAATVDLAAGYNQVFVKVCGQAEAPKFALRIGDASGAPDLGIDAVATPDAAATYAASRRKTSEANRRAPAGVPASTPTGFRRRGGGVEGPMQALSRAAEAPGAGPDALEAYARYLTVTGGDDQSEHRARDLARRAADAQPTVARLLFAGRLTEDRNQNRAWLDRAAKLAGPATRDLELLYAQALLEHTSPNGRQALPIYQRMLAIDPDDVGATLGVVSLYTDAGLKRTALGVLERAVARQPTCIALLRAYARELHDVDRDADAADAEARYAALRFDDTAFLGQQVELAVARRDRPGAERWLERMLRVDPDSSFTRAVAARTYRALGQKDRAVAAYERALVLAPEDIGALRALSDLQGEEGNADQQLKLLRQILVIAPQAKDVREYVEHIEPPKPRADEVYAWNPDKFLPMRIAPSEHWPKRTLRELTVTTVFPNGLASRFRQIVFQPLTEEAAARAREFAFEYQADHQAVTLRGAKVYRSDNRVDEATESGETGANNPAIAMYTSTRTFFVHFPRLQAGDVVELRYRVDDVSARNEIADYFGELEYLGSDEPVASAEFVLITPSKRTFNVGVSGLPGLTRTSTIEGDRRIERFAAKDIPPLAPEPNMAPWGEILGHIHVSTFKTWDEMGAWYWGLAKDQLDVDDEVRRRVKEITKGLKDDASKVRAIYKFATQTRYVALEFGMEGIRPRRCAQTLARGWGDCKDKATLIVTMLREVGIPATLVVVRTGMRGRIESEPASLAPFDHAIAYVPSLDLYLDGTAEHTGSTELPVMDRDAVALQINEGKPKFVHMPQPPPEASVTRRKVEVALAADGTGPFAMEMQVTGAYAPAWRSRYLAEGTRRERATGDLASEIGSVELAPGKAGVDVNDLDDEEQPVRVRSRGRALVFARREGDALSVPAGPAHALVGEYASLSTRKLDLVLHALSQREDEWSVKLPPGMRVVRAPTPTQLDTPYGRFSLGFEEVAGKVVVKSSLAFKKARITPDEYAGWRAFCEGVDRTFGQRIVIAK